MEKESPDFQLPSNPENDNAEILTDTVKPGTPPRKDKGRLHIGRHGIFAANAIAALAKGGENTRALRRIEKDLRAQIRPRGALESVVFDRLWTALLRCLLAARAESQIFLAGGLPVSFDERARRNRAMIRATGNPKAIDQGDDLLDSLTILQRYDGYNWGEFRRALDLLAVLRKGGRSGPAQASAETFQQNLKQASPDESKP